MGILFAALFLASTAAHLYFSWKDHRRGRAWTKPFPIALLGLFYCFCVEAPSPVLLAALFTSWLGDVLLIPRGNRWFIIGGSSFLLSHLLFMAVYLPHIRPSSVPWLLMVPMAAVYVTVSVKCIRAVKDNMPKIMAVSMWLYLIANSCMNLLALMLLTTAGTAGGAVAYAGAVLFFASDCILFLVRYHKNPKIIPRKHFPVMLCYITGELLITLGMMMIG